VAEVVANLRLFGPARVAAGETSVELDGLTVGDVLAAAEVRFGEHLAAVIATSSIWVNGAAASLDDQVSGADEVSVIPPVSGG
jgi:molybdopterin converting factor small subunit